MLDLPGIPSETTPPVDTNARDARQPGKPYKLANREGMYLCVVVSGAKSWHFDYRLAGKRETLTVRRYPEKSLAQVRDELKEARKLRARGNSPVGAEHNAKE